MGFQLIAPHMPWSEKHGYHGSRSQALALIELAINLKNNRDVVLIGHDLGSIMVMQYVSTNPSLKVKAIVLVAPAHDPNMDRKLYEVTANDAKKACNMVRNGKKIDYAVSADMSFGVTSFIEATAEYYCSFYNIAEFLGTMKRVGQIKLPTLLIVSTSDPSNAVYSQEAIFNALPANDKNQFMKLSGSNNRVLYKHVAEIAAWIDSLQ